MEKKSLKNQTAEAQTKKQVTFTVLNKQTAQLRLRKKAPLKTLNKQEATAPAKSEIRLKMDQQAVRTKSKRKDPLKNLKQTVKTQSKTKTPLRNRNKQTVKAKTKKTGSLKKAVLLKPFKHELVRNDQKSKIPSKGAKAKGSKPVSAQGKRHKKNQNVKSKQVN